MSYLLLHPMKNHKVLIWLADELEKLMPNLELFGSDKSVLLYAHQDLQVCLALRLKAKNTPQLHIKLRKTVEKNPDEVKAFLKVWVGQWMEKWRKRVTFSSEIPKISRRYYRNLTKAQKLYTTMGERRQLIDLVVQRLINKGEVCRPRQIADDLIVKEIASQLNKYPDRKLTVAFLNVPKIVHGVYAQIEKLADSKRPLLHLKIINNKHNI
jgi:hypothetical protein